MMLLLLLWVSVYSTFASINEHQNVVSTLQYNRYKGRNGEAIGRG